MRPPSVHSACSPWMGLQGESRGSARTPVRNPPPRRTESVICRRLAPQSIGEDRSLGDGVSRDVIDMPAIRGLSAAGGHRPAEPGPKALRTDCESRRRRRSRSANCAKTRRDGQTHREDRRDQTLPAGRAGQLDPSRIRFSCSSSRLSRCSRRASCPALDEFLDGVEAIRETTRDTEKIIGRSG